MTLLDLVARNALRNRPRFVLSTGAVVVAFILLGLLLPVQRLFQSRVDFANASRLMVINRASMMRPLPINYGDRIAEVPGVAAVSHFTFFGGAFQSPANPVAAIVTDVRKFPAMVGEIRFGNQAELADWFADPASIAVGRALAKRYDWHVGDVVPIYSGIYARRDGNAVWTFRIATIFDPATADGQTDSMIVNYAYFDEARAMGQHSVGWFAVMVDDPRHASAVGQAIDRLFANAPDETSSTTERAFAQSFLEQVGDFRAMIGVALALVFWTLLLITANAMSQAIGERGTELAVMRTLGFGQANVAGLVLAESILLLVSGAAIGLAAAGGIVLVVARQSTQLLSTVTVAPSDWLLGLSLAAGIGLLVGLPPAWRAFRLDIMAGLAEAV